MKITEYIKDNILLLDGAMGSLLQQRGLKPGEAPEGWCLSHPELVTQAHREYFEAGSNAVLTNTFGLSSFKYSKAELENIVCAAIKCARAAERSAEGEGERFVALDIGPTGRMLKPYGELEFEAAVDSFKLLASLGEKYGADFIFIETMSDSLESKAALLGAKEGSGLPVFVSNAYDKSGKLMTGASPTAMLTMLESMGALAVGINCSFGPKQAEGVVNEYLSSSVVPVIFKPNAGLPRVENGRTVYDLSPKEFAKEVHRYVSLGASVVGGCCGTTPEHIRELSRLIKNKRPVTRKVKKATRVASYTHSVTLGEKFVTIGERINPTGKKRLKEALLSGDLGYVVSEGIKQQEAGADLLDVNVGLPKVNEPEMLKRVVKELQAVCNLPLCLDSSDPSALEAAMRVYNGKPLVNSVSGERESMNAVFPLLKKYGGAVIALTLDESGIPKTAEERLSVAKKILEEAKKYGLSGEDIIFDPLAMAVSADKSSAKECLKAIRMIKEELFANCSLGISNISFGLPERERINAAFLSMAISNGLSMAIVNPLSESILEATRTALCLMGEDEGFKNYIDYSESHALRVPEACFNASAENSEGLTELGNAVAKGLKDRAKTLAKELVGKSTPLDIVEGDIVPALCAVGKRYEEGRAYLPTLLMSAEAAEAALSVVKESCPCGKLNNGGVSVILATVKGDVHDIGKNIARMIIESFGYTVYDLGKDVPPERILEVALEKNARIVGLSALMTTTLPAMEETVRLLKKKKPYTKIMIGGAVVTEEYKEHIGADFYAENALDGIRYVEQIDAEMRAEIFG